VTVQVRTKVANRKLHPRFQLEPKQESSTKLTNHRVSYAFTSIPFSFHACHI